MDNDLNQANQSSLKSSLQNQIIACIICNLGAFSFGSAMGWSSPALRELKMLGELSDDEFRWAGGLLPLGALVSLPVFSYIARVKGRKAAAYVIGIPLAVGFALKAWGDSSISLLIGRFLCGLGGGGSLSLPPLYMGEICEPRARGFLSSFMMVEFSLGLFLANVLGAILPDIHILPAALLPIPIIFLLTFWFMPETPTYRLRHRQEEEAARALAWLRKLPLNSIEIKEELTQIAARLGLKLPLPPPPRRCRIGRRKSPSQSYLGNPAQIDSSKGLIKQEQKHTKKQRANMIKQHFSPFKKLITNKAGLRGLGLCLGLVTAQTFMGILAISAYAASIFEQAGAALSPYLCAILYATIVVVGSICSSLLMDKIGRRILQITSCVIVCICHFILGISLTALNNGLQGYFLQWIPLIFLPICVFTFNIGAGGIPFVILTEIFAPEVQDLVTNIVMTYVWLTCFFLLQYFPLCVAIIGLHNVFFGFSAVSFLAVIYSYYFLIETKEKTLEQILQLLLGVKPDDLVNDQKSIHPLKAFP